MVDQGKTGFGNQKGKYGQQWQTGAAKSGNQTKAKEKRWLINGNSRTWQMSGSMTKELRMVGFALVGNQMQYTKDSFKAKKLNKFMGLHRPTKETWLQALTQMLS